METTKKEETCATNQYRKGKNLVSFKAQCGDQRNKQEILLSCHNNILKDFLRLRRGIMPISHKIRQYGVLFGVCALGRNPLVLGEPGGRSSAKQGIWRGFKHPILTGSPQGLGIGLLEQSRSPSLVV